jgi:predicted MFS family arabinose efflux permease
VVFSGMTMASVAGVPLASWLAATLGWRAMFGVTAVLGLLAAGATWRLVRATPAGAQVRWADFGRLLAAPDVLAAQAVMVLAMTALFCTYTLITPILGSRFHASAASISIALGIYGVAGLLGNRAARHAAARWSAERSILTALAVLCIAFLGVRLLPPGMRGAIGLVMLLMAFWAVAIDLFLPAQQRRMIELRPQASGLVLALNSSTLFVGMALGSFAGGLLSRTGGLDIVPLASCALAGAAALALHASNKVGARA